MAVMNESPYHARLQRVLDHIDRNLDGDLDLETLSGVAAFSPHHFHRQFSALLGLSLGRYVQLARLKRAASRLAYRPKDPILQIALDCGYAGPEAFARAFRQRVGQSPSAFRRQPDWSPWHAAQAPLVQARSKIMTHAFTDADVRIIDFPETPVARLSHHGDPAKLGDTIRRFIAWRREAGLPPRLSATFNILPVDPETTEPCDYRLDLCAATSLPIPDNLHGVVADRIPRGRCAVVRQTGSGDDLRPAAQLLYADWLPRSGEELRDFPLFAQRVTFFPDVPEGEAVTDLFLPLR